eukprot:236798_1
MKMGLHWNSLFSVIIYPLLLPIYVYGTIKWYKWRYHSLFRYRYSFDAAVIVLMLYIVLHITIINTTLSDLKLISANTDRIFAAIVYALWWIVYSMIYYRTNLIFITWKIYQSQLNDVKQGQILPRRHCTSQFLLIFTFLGALVIFVFYISVFIYFSVFLWWLNYLLGIIIMITVKCK